LGILGVQNMKITINGFMQKVGPEDIIAAFVIVGGMVLVGFGINGVVGTAVATVSGYYLGHKRK